MEKKLNTQITRKQTEKMMEILVITGEVEMLISQRKLDGNQAYKSSYYEEENQKNTLQGQKTEGKKDICYLEW